MSFKDMVEADNLNVFLDTGFFAEHHNIRYDGVIYESVPCVITQLKEQDRSTPMSDHAQGVYRVTAILHCRLDDIGGLLPEKGGKIHVSDEGFMRRYFVAQSGCEMGMVRLELEALDE
jgi:hypothetical protein